MLTMYADQKDKKPKISDNKDGNLGTSFVGTRIVSGSGTNQDPERDSSNMTRDSKRDQKDEAQSEAQGDMQSGAKQMACVCVDPKGIFMCDDDKKKREEKSPMSFSSHNLEDSI